MRRIVLAVAVFAFAAGAFAQRVDELNGRHVQLHPTNEHATNPQELGWAKPGGGSAQNLVNHGGPVIASATVIAIYWGSQWSTGTGASTASTMNGFFQSFGSTGEYKTVEQYGIQTGLGADSWFDASNPPTNVTDAAVQGEVVKYLKAIGSIGDSNTIYEVFLPSTSYASYGSSDSCGGPNLQFCAYHSNFSYGTTGGTTDVKYASMPYPSCSGCHASGFFPVQDLQHFACHETREAVTDPDGTAWYDRRGYEADDKCAWSPAPFIDGLYGYQYEWSNAVGGCVQRVP
jgi:hypothetical protein